MCSSDLPHAALGRAQILAQYYSAPALMQLERHDDALIILAAAARLRPQEPSVLYTQALTLTRLERFREAIIYLEKAVAADPGNADAWMLLGRLLTQHDGSLEAILRATEAFEQALARRPDRAGSAERPVGTEGTLPWAPVHL